MSFGFSISDLITLIQLTTQTYRNWKDACGEFAEITGQLDSLAIILRRIEAETKVPLARGTSDSVDVAQILKNLNSVVAQLKNVVKKHKSLGKSRSRNWDRLRLANNNLGDLRSKLTVHTSALATYLDTVGISALGRVESKVDELPEMRSVIDDLAKEIRAGRHEGSVMTTYSDDEKEVWRQFRRELVGEGFSSHSIRKFKTPLKEYLRRLDEDGLLGEEEPGDSADDGGDDTEIADEPGRGSTLENVPARSIPTVSKECVLWSQPRPIG